MRREYVGRLQLQRERIFPIQSGGTPVSCFFLCFSPHKYKSWEVQLRPARDKNLTYSRDGPTCHAMATGSARHSAGIIATEQSDNCAWGVVGDE